MLRFWGPSVRRSKDLVKNLLEGLLIIGSMSLREEKLMYVKIILRDFK